MIHPDAAEVVSLYLKNWIVEGRFKHAISFFLESLIPAQDKRWRRA